MRTIPKLALTGGPCAAKTTAKTFLMQKLRDAGFHVLFVPEAATILLENGVRPGPAFQKQVLRMIRDLEANFMGAANLLDPDAVPVIICDRGLMDGLAYCGDRDAFARWLADMGLTFVDARDGQYDAVFHLRTAALGAEAFYTLETNAVRSESPREARALDAKILEAWMGHSHLRVIPNNGTLEDKLRHLLAEVCVVLGIPEPVETERRFLVAPDFDIGVLAAHATVEIEQLYLLSNEPAGGLRFRKRSQDGSAVYFKTLKRPGPHPSSRIETEDFITAEQYEFGRQFQIPGSRVVRKKRHCFVYEEQYFELDVFENPVLPHALLELELAFPDQALTLPPFLRVEREVTGDEAYGNYALAMMP